MSLITIGIIVVALFLLFLGLFFWSSGALVIDEQERKDIRHKSQEELEEELKAERQTQLEEIKAEEDEFYSHG